MVGKRTPSRLATICLAVVFLVSFYALSVKDSFIGHVRIGMDLNEVKRILGEPSEKYYERNGYEAWVYRKEVKNVYWSWSWPFVEVIYDK